MFYEKHNSNSVNTTNGYTITKTIITDKICMYSGDALF